MPDSAKPEDIIINEVLFNPKRGGNDFIEVYNRTEKYLDLSKWTFSNNNSIKNYPFTTKQLLIYPYSYMVFTSDKELLKIYYPDGEAENFYKTVLPPLNDDRGTICIKDNMGTVIDSMAFDEKMHHILIKEKEGVSLERISPNSPSIQAGSWHSAASSANYATPGYQNSQTFHTVSNENFSIDPRVFSPNQDGYNDFAVVKYRLDHSGYVGSLNIYDASGRHIKTIANNFLLSTEGIFQWDGTDKEHNMATPGQYILVFNSYHISGDVKDFKEVVVLGF